MAVTLQKVSGSYTGTSEAQAFIENQIAAASTHVNSSQGLVEELNTTIRASMDEDFDVDFDDIEFDVDPATFDPDSISSIAQPVAPDVDLSNDTDIVFNDIADGDAINVTLPDSPDLTDVSTISIGTAPTLSVADPSTDFTYSPSGYVSGLAEFVQQKIRESFAAEDELTQLVAESNVALDGNTTDVALVDTDIERAIYDRAVSRMVDEEAKSISDAEATIQARGFSLPPGALSSQLATLSKSAMKAREDLSNDIIKSQIELEQKRTEYGLQRAGIVTDAQYKHDTILTQIHGVNVEYVKARAQNRGIYIDAAAKLEAVLVDIYTTEETLKSDAEKLSLQASIDIYNAKVASFKQLMEAYKIESDIAIASTKAEVDRNNGLVAIYTAEVNAAKVEIEAKNAQLEGKKVNADIEKISVAAQVEKVKAENDRLNTIANVYSTSVEAFAAKISAMKTVEMLDLERYSIETTGKAAEVNAKVNKATAEIDAALKKYSVDMETLKQQSTLAGNIVSSALNSINTSASYGYSGSRSRSESISEGSSVGHSYNYIGEIGETA